MTLEKKFSSMTGHGKGLVQNNQLEISIEIKSLNNRFREFKWRVPSVLASFELSARKMIESYFKRGSFDINANIKYSNENNFSSKVDLKKVQVYIDQFKELPSKIEQKIDLTSFLRTEFLLNQDQLNELSLEENYLSCLKNACENLQKSRQEEGSKVLEVLNNLQNKLLALWEKIKELQFESVEAKKIKIRNKIEELMKDNIDEQRLAQEFIYFAQKLDIQEEIDRFQMHRQKLVDLLKYNHRDDRGKELEFVLQELGRETNTLSNKADNTKISHYCVEIKVILENMREQILNVE